jgi:hypothetical protein
VLRNYNNAYFGGYNQPTQQRRFRPMPGNRRILAQGGKKMAMAYLIPATVDGPLPFGDAVGAVAAGAIGVSMIGFVAVGTVSNAKYFFT